MRTKLMAAAAAVLLLTGCAGGADPREEVQAAILDRLVPASFAESAADGDEAAVAFVDQMHELSQQLTADIIDDGMCGSAAYLSGISSAPEVVAAHEAGCATAADLGAID